MLVSFRHNDDSFLGRMLISVPEKDWKEYFKKFTVTQEKMDDDRTEGQYDVQFLIQGEDYTQYFESAGWNLLEQMSNHLDEKRENLAIKLKQLQDSKDAMDFAIKEKAEDLISKRCESLIDNMHKLQYDSWQIMEAGPSVNRPFVEDVKKLLDAIRLSHSACEEFETVEEHLKSSGVIDG